MGGRGKFGFVADFALEGHGAEIEGIAARETQLDDPAVIFELVNAVGEELAVEKDISGGSLGAHVVAVYIDEAEIAADGGDIDAAGAAGALKGAADGFNGEIAAASSCKSTPAPTVSTFISPATLATVTAPESS